MFHLNFIFNFAGLQRKLSSFQAKMEYFGASNPPIENWRQFFCKIVTLILVRGGGEGVGQGGEMGEGATIWKKAGKFGKS